MHTFLEGCTIGQKNDTSSNCIGTLEFQSNDTMEQLKDMEQNAEPEVENNQVSESAPKTQGLELNEKYRGAEEYPMAELFMMPHD